MMLQHCPVKPQWNTTADVLMAEDVWCSVVKACFTYCWKAASLPSWASIPLGISNTGLCIGLSACWLCQPRALKLLCCVQLGESRSGWGDIAQTSLLGSAQRCRQLYTEMKLLVADWAYQALSALAALLKAKPGVNDKVFFRSLESACSQTAFLAAPLFTACGRFVYVRLCKKYLRVISELGR